MGVGGMEMIASSSADCSGRGVSRAASNLFLVVLRDMGAMLFSGSVSGMCEGLMAVGGEGRRRCADPVGKRASPRPIGGGKKWSFVSCSWLLSCRWGWNGEESRC
jgi:hypothetical protein